MSQEIADEAATVEEIVQRLAVKFPDHSPDTIRAIVVEDYEELNDAHVRDFVAVLVEKQSKKRLKKLPA
jgi:Mg2+/Co2+ transporter CorB